MQRHMGPLEKSLLRCANGNHALSEVYYNPFFRRVNEKSPHFPEEMGAGLMRDYS
jgi:hypothetical protein